MNQNNEVFIIFDQQLAGLLMFLRHRLKKCRPDRDDITKNVFIFDKTNEFLRDFNYLKDNKDKIKIY